MLLVNKDEARDPDSSDPSSKKDANKPNTAVESRESSTLERTKAESHTGENCGAKQSTLVSCNCGGEEVF